VTGTSSGPSSGSCGDWRWGVSDCSAPDPCNAYDDSCGTCTAETGCGWCESTWTCLTGTGSGPEVGWCDDWRWSTPDCS
jgi:hypothetical protein